jgi:hypothetical protein
MVLGTVEYFSLFLPQHPSPLPDGVTSGTSKAARSWRTNMKGIINTGWHRVKDFYDEHNLPYSEKVSMFKKFMSSVDPSTLPEGPEGETPFQPIKGDKVIKLRTTRDEILAKKQKGRKVR